MKISHASVFFLLRQSIWSGGIWKKIFCAIVVEVKPTLHYNGSDSEKNIVFPPPRVSGNKGRNHKEK